MRKKREPPARTDHSRDLGDRRVDVIDVFEHETGDGGVEAGIGERQLGGARPQVRRSPTALLGDADLVPRRVDPDDADPGSRRAAG